MCSFQSFFPKMLQSELWCATRFCLKSPSFVSSRLVSGLPESAISDLMLVQDAAARILTRTSEHGHTTLVLACLHLLLILTRVDCRTFLLTYTVLNSLTHPPQLNC